MPSSMKEEMKQIIIGSTLRTQTARPYRSPRRPSRPSAESIDRRLGTTERWLITLESPCFHPGRPQNVWAANTSASQHCRYMTTGHRLERDQHVVITVTGRWTPKSHPRQVSGSPLRAPSTFAHLRVVNKQEHRSGARAVMISHVDAAHANALNTAETTAGTMPSSMNEGMKQIIIGSTLRTPTARARTWSAPRRTSLAAAAWCCRLSTIEVPDSTERARSSAASPSC